MFRCTDAADQPWFTRKSPKIESAKALSIWATSSYVDWYFLISNGTPLPAPLIIPPFTVGILKLGLATDVPTNTPPTAPDKASNAISALDLGVTAPAVADNVPSIPAAVATVPILAAVVPSFAPMDNPLIMLPATLEVTIDTGSAILPRTVDQGYIAIALSSSSLS